VKDDRLLHRPIDVKLNKLCGERVLGIPES